MAADFLWPETELMPNHIGHDLVASLIEGPDNINFVPDAVSANGFLNINFVDVPLTDPHYIRLWRALQAGLEGRAKSILIPLYDANQAPQVAFSAQSGGFGAGESEGVIVVSAPDVMQEGMFFGLDEHAYMVRTIGTPAGLIYPVTIFPSARLAISAGAELDFLTPKCRVRLRNDDSMHVTYRYRQAAFGQAEFTEDIE